VGDESVPTWIINGASHGFFNNLPWLKRTIQRVNEFLQSIGYFLPELKVKLPTKEKPSNQNRECTKESRENLTAEAP